MQDQNLAAWLSLSMTPGVSAKLFYALLENKTSPPDFLKADFSFSGKHRQGGDADKFTAACRQLARSKQVKEKVQRALAWRQQEDCHILTLDCAEYPALLKAIPDPPPLLYVQGSPTILNWPWSAVENQPRGAGPWQGIWPLNQVRRILSYAVAWPWELIQKVMLALCRLVAAVLLYWAAG